MQAARDLQLGDILFSEEPYAAVLDNQFVHTHCSYCFKESLTLIPLVEDVINNLIITKNIINSIMVHNLNTSINICHCIHDLLRIYTSFSW